MLMVGRDLKIRIGSLGVVEFKRGYYVYVGPGQRYLEKRIQRHKKRVKKVKWHIDYLTTNTGVKVMEAAAYDLPKKYECILADMLRSMGFKPVKGFGSTDCKCVSHLYQIDVDFDRIVDEVSDKVRVKPIRLDP